MSMRLLARILGEMRFPFRKMKRGIRFLFGRLLSYLCLGRPKLVQTEHVVSVSFIPGPCAPQFDYRVQRDDSSLCKMSPY